MTRNAKNTTPATAKADTAAPKKKGVGPFKYLSQVRQEARKVTWTTRQETLVSTVLVLILTLIAMFFFWGVDTLISTTIQFILSQG
ncbi:preprotein translocase subunit SecE [Maricaulis sp.]|uniref:preprotein translocase subunit SecE n=1 Tax=Maricaulis sp. TaxID=1486257 RepID=UPI003A90A919